MSWNITGLLAIGVAILIAVLVSQGLMDVDVFLQALGVVSTTVLGGSVGYQLRGRQDGERAPPVIGGDSS